MNRKPVDIVIPIYNAYDDVVACVNSVKDNTNLDFHRLLLVNDCSPDERIQPYLDSLAKENIAVIHNESNKGFSGNVNIGMDYTDDRDIIILNSDTLVTKNWLEKMIDCAYSAEEIGTVTPLSNAATLCSIPRMCVDNACPDSINLEQYAETVERCSLKAYPRIPVAVGFCMYIKRTVINEIGHFDAETFQRGYGEENDFCHRAEQRGFIHVMCDNTFILHKGSASFQAEDKKKLIEAHEKIVDERYPAQNHEISVYCNANPDQYIRDNVNLYTELLNGKKNILYVIHMDFRGDSITGIGGTQLHLKNLVDNLKYEYNVFVLARDGEKLRLSIYNGEKRSTLKYNVGTDHFPYFYRKNEYQIIENILKAFCINLVHVHHTRGMSFDIFSATKELKIPLILSLHDYYYVCPSINLYSSQVGLCIGKESSEVCKECLRENCGYAMQVDILDKWREECKRVLSQCDVIITPSCSTKEIYSKYYPDIEDKIKVISHGREFDSNDNSKKWIIEPKEVLKNRNVKAHIDSVEERDGNMVMVTGWSVIKNVPSSDTKIYVEVTSVTGEKIMFPAAMGERPDVASFLKNEMYVNSGFKVLIYKGALIHKMAKYRIVVEHNGVCYSNNKYYPCSSSINVQSNLEESFNVAFIGAIGEKKGSKDIARMIEKQGNGINWFLMGLVGDTSVLKVNNPNVHVTGPYSSNDIPSMIKKYKIDLVVILSVVPETFSYTISEAILCGVPVLVRDIGALGERIRDNKCGWIVSTSEDANSILQEIERIRSNSDEYLSVKKIVENYHSKTIKEMTNEYRELYSEYADFMPSHESFDAKQIFSAIVEVNESTSE